MRAPSNHFLDGLSPADLQILTPHLRQVTLARGMRLHETGDVIERIYFPLSGVISIVVHLQSGEMIEAAMLGRDSVVGGSAVLNGKLAVNRAMVQIGGEAMAADIEAIRGLADAGLGFRSALMRFDQAVLIQAQQSAACNALHRIDARFCRWLLRARDLAGDYLPFTQEFVAEMLGVRRTSVSVVAHTLSEAGFIRYRRGQIYIDNVEGLRGAACECHRTISGQMARLAGDAKRGR
jgi:CRP-like cAMP-binding protein